MESFRKLLYFYLIFFLVSCGGGGNSPSAPDPVVPNQYPTHPLIWDVVTPESAGMSSSKLDQAFDYAFQDGAYTPVSYTHLTLPTIYSV